MFSDENLTAPVKNMFESSRSRKSERISLLTNAFVSLWFNLDLVFRIGIQYTRFTQVRIAHDTR